MAGTPPEVRTALLSLLAALPSRREGGPRENGAAPAQLPKLDIMHGLLSGPASRPASRLSTPATTAGARSLNWTEDLRLGVISMSGSSMRVASHKLDAVHPA